MLRTCLSDALVKIFCPVFVCCVRSGITRYQKSIHPNSAFHSPNRKENYRAIIAVRVKGGMSLRNGMWHGLRNGMWHGLRNEIIMRNEILVRSLSIKIVTELTKAPNFAQL